MIKTYRNCVSCVILNDEKLVFFAKRIDVDNGWQCPQGGIDEGESEEIALKRELLEEIGTNDVEILKKAKNLLRYDLPEDVFQKMKQKWENPFTGQEQRWFLCKLNPLAQINLATKHPEFNDYKWVTPMEALELCVDFKKDILKSVFKEFDIC